MKKKKICKSIENRKINTCTATMALKAEHHEGYICSWVVRVEARFSGDKKSVSLAMNAFNTKDFYKIRTF